jgi:hypothetical protein
LERLQQVYDLQAGWAKGTPGVSALHQSRGHPEGGPDVLFVIRRSSNKNTVVYTGSPGEGVSVQWIMFEKEGKQAAGSSGGGGGAPTEELTYMEKNSAYGTSVKKVAKPTPLPAAASRRSGSNGGAVAVAGAGAGAVAVVVEQYELVLSALKEKVIDLRLEQPSDASSARGSRWVATTTIGGVADVQLLAVYVHLKPKSMVPSVQYVELVGVDGYELIEKSKGSGAGAREKSLGMLESMRGEVSRVQQEHARQQALQQQVQGYSSVPSTANSVEFEARATSMLGAFTAVAVQDSNGRHFIKAFELGQVVTN